MITSLYLAISDVDHMKTKVMSPKTNGICEHFHKTIFQEFYQVTFGKKLYADLESLQMDLDNWLCSTIMSELIKNERTHQGKYAAAYANGHVTCWETGLGR